jgi:serine/threonine protein phosphatase 1
MLDRIGEHSQALPPAENLHLVFVGDLVDRGPESARVVEFLNDLQSRTDQIIVLKGNHEEAMVKSYEGDISVLKRWIAVGGAETLQSYGLDLPDSGTNMRQYLRYLQSGLPSRQLQWLRDLPLTAQSGDYFFCHAGVRPGVALKRQARDDLLWIRDDFMDSGAAHGAVIVHGHTIEPQVTLRSNRIGIDIGAYRTGLLGAIYLEDDRQEVITVN